MAPRKPDTNVATNRSSSRVADPQARISKPWTVKTYRNGLLNLNAPARLLNITKKNSTSSPLLSLPAELRNRIFAYALGGHLVTIKTKVTLDDGETNTYMHKITNTALPLSGSLDSYTMPSFQLPRVCRQIYAETALLPYKLNTFKFVGRARKFNGKHSGYAYGPMDCWLENRIPAQIKAIESLEVHDEYRYQYLHGRRPAFKNRFPNLRSVVLTVPTFSTYASIIFERLKSQAEALERPVLEIEWRSLGWEEWAAWVQEARGL